MLQMWWGKYRKSWTWKNLELSQERIWKDLLSKKFVKPSHLLSQVEYKHLNIINQEDCVICADSLEVRSDNESKSCVNEF